MINCRDRVLYFAPVICALLYSALAPAQESLRDAERRIQDGWNTVSTLTAVVRLESFLPHNSEEAVSTGTGQIEYLKVSPEPKYRQQMTITAPPPVDVEAYFEFLFDGEQLYLINEIMGNRTIAMAEKADLQSGALPPGGKPLLDMLRTEFELRALPGAEVDGRTVIVLEGRRRTPDPADPVHTARFYIDRENGIQRRAEFFDAAGALNTRIRFEDLRLNMPIPADRFVYTGPTPGEAPPAPESSGETLPPPLRIP